MKFILNDGTQQHPFEIPPGTTIIGRDSTCTLRLKSTKVSRRHVECVCEGGSVRLRDLGSSNGTIVNGVKITEPVVLQNGDVVRLGGFQLVFQSEDGAVPPPQPIDAEIVGQPMEGGNGFGPAIPPGATAAQPGYPEDSSTPPDGTYLPEVYRADAGQPMLTQRDGRWFLRDPRTNREIEIVPKGAAQPEEKRRRFATFAIIGGASVLCIVLVVMAIHGNRDDRLVPTHKYSDVQYNEMIDKAIKEHEAGKVQASLSLLAEAHADRPEFKIAATLRDVIQLLDKAGPDGIGLDFNKIDSLLKDLADRAKTGALKAQVESWQAKMLFIQGEIALLTKAKDLEAKAEFVKAFETAAQLRADSPVRKANEAYIRLLQDKSRQQFVAQAVRAKAERKWDDAISFYEQAIKYAPSVNHMQEIIAEQKVCAQEKVNTEYLLDAQAKFEAGDYADALAAIQRVEDKSLSYDEAQLLKARALEAQDLDNAKSLYSTGRAQDAIDFITGRRLESMYGLRDRASKVLQAYEEAKKLDEQAGRRSEAAAAYQRVVDLESDENNYYHKLAKKRMDKLNDNKEAVAQDHMTRAFEAFNKGDIAASRRFVDLAQEIKPDLGVDLLRRLDTEARSSYYKGLGLKGKGEPLEACILFKRALQFAKPGGDIYTKALSELKEME